MSLRPIGDPVTGIIDYQLCPGVGIYNPSLCTPPRIYKERVSSIGHFFYEPSNDRLVSYMLFYRTDWPGWDALMFTWDAGTGERISQTFCGIWAYAYPNHASIGSYNKLFTTWNSGYTISEVPWNTLDWNSPMWTINPYTWNPPKIYNWAVVNLQDNLIGGITDWNLDIWNISGTPAMLASLRLPNVPGYLCMESREICWVITRDGLILKCNYKHSPPRWEMLSSVQNPTPDSINHFIAWDPKRARLAVLRQRPDAEDGANQSQLEFYQPIVKIVGLTDPVPVNRHHAGDVVEFVAHLYGGAGEGITPYRIIGSLDTPAQGSLIRAEGTSSVNGSVSLLYEGPESIIPLTVTGESVAGVFSNDGFIGLDWILEFNGAVSNVPVVPTTISMDLTVVRGGGGTDEFVITDDGAGVLYGEDGGAVVTGTINYTTGAVYLRFLGSEDPDLPVADYQCTPETDTLILEATINDGAL